MSREIAIRVWNTIRNIQSGCVPKHKDDWGKTPTDLIEEAITQEVKKATEGLVKALGNIGCRTEHNYEEEKRLGYCPICKIVDDAIKAHKEKYGE